jgi:hypothetical protein
MHYFYLPKSDPASSTNIDFIEVRLLIVSLNLGGTKFSLD